MDLLLLIKRQIESLPEGPHVGGLNSILRHIDTAYRHLYRGQSDGDDTAFNDVILRANQAFEGSIKEAYRVLADKDPQKLRPFDIEKYLEEEKIFKDRVLSLFTNYRREWRNPSTHDHTLDFDEDEAFLAVVSVSAFCKLLMDQIAEKLSFDAARTEIQQYQADIKPSVATKALIDRVGELFIKFVDHYTSQKAAVPIESEAQLMGALAGFLSSVAPDLQTSTGRIVRTSKSNYIDMIIEKENEQLIVELKRGQSENLVEQGTNQLMSYMGATNADNGILFMYVASAREYVSENFDDSVLEKKLRILRPRR